MYIAIYLKTKKNKKNIMAKDKKRVDLQANERLEINIVISKYTNIFSIEKVLKAVLPKLKINQKPWIEAMKQIIKDYEN